MQTGPRLFSASTSRKNKAPASPNNLAEAGGLTSLKKQKILEMLRVARIWWRRLNRNQCLPAEEMREIVPRQTSERQNFALQEIEKFSFARAFGSKYWFAPRLKKQKRPETQWFQAFSNGGLEGIRTLDLSDANRTLSQLSYEPGCNRNIIS